MEKLIVIYRSMRYDAHMVAEAEIPCPTAPPQLAFAIRWTWAFRAGERMKRGARNQTAVKSLETHNLAKPAYFAPQ
jgi:hypothetical protein